MAWGPREIALVTGNRLAPPEMPNWPRWLRLKLAAAYVGVSSAQFQREVRMGPEG